MVRGRVSLVLALALPALAACKKKTPPYRLDLLPGEATVVAGVDVAGLRKTPHYDLLSAMDFSWGGLAALPSCGDPPELTRILGASRTGIPADPAVIIVEGAGVGAAERRSCLSRAGLQLVEPDAKDAPDHGWSAIILSDDTLVLAYPGAWAEAVLERRRGHGPAVTEGALGKGLEHTDLGQHAWVVGVPPESSAQTLRSELGYVPSFLSLTANLAANLVLEVHIAAPEPEVASDRLDERWDEWRPRARERGVPSSVVNSVSIRATDDTVLVRAQVDRAYFDFFGALATLGG